MSAPRRFLDRARRLGADEGGQISFLMLFGAVAFVGLFGLVMTTGDQAAQKIRMQNTVDAAALSGGAWIARGLNVTSALNVVQTQLVGGAILLTSLGDTIKAAQPIVQLMCVGYTMCAAIPWTRPICYLPKLITCKQAPLLSTLDRWFNGRNGISTKLAKCPDGLFWRVAKVLEKLNAGIRISFYGIAFFESAAVARANGADFAVFLAGPLFHGNIDWGALTLPTRAAEFPAACPPMEEGSPQPDQRGYSPLLGYPVGQGPFKLGKCRLKSLLWFLTGVPPVGPALFEAIAEQQKDALCGRQAWSPIETEVIRPAKDLEECRSLGGTATWRYVRLDIGRELPKDKDGCDWLAEQVGDTGVEDYDALPDSGVVRGPRDEVKSCDYTPPGRALNPGTYCKLEFQDPTDVPGELHLDTVEVHQLIDMNVKDEITVDQNPLGGSCHPPKPYLLAPENDALHYLAIARRHNRRVFFTDHFLEEPPDFYTYAQVEVYNGVSEDAFTQDWRVRLAPARLVETPLRSLAGALPEGMEEALSLFDIDPRAYADALARVNNH